MVKYILPDESRTISLTLERYNKSENSEIALKANGKIIARISTYNDEPQIILYQGAEGFKAEISDRWS